MRKTKSSPLMQEIENALDLGSFVDYKHSYAFISGLEAVKGQIDKLLAERIERASHAELTALSHYRTEPAAKALRKSHPLLAAKVFRALGMRILESKKSKYYRIAHDHFEQAKKLYEVSGHPEEWQLIVAIVRAEHKRKSGFMEGFERIVAGSGPAKRPTFQERIQARLRRYSNH